MQHLRSSNSGHLLSHSALPATDSAPLPFWQLCLSTTSGSGSVELAGFCSPMIFRHAPIPQKGSENKNNNLEKIFERKICSEFEKAFVLSRRLFIYVYELITLFANFSDWATTTVDCLTSSLVCHIQAKIAREVA